MREYLCVSGNTHYILSPDTGEARMFTDMGVDRGSIPYPSAVTLAGKYPKEIQIISILGESLKEVCEVFYKGKGMVVNENYLNVYSKLSKLPKVSHLVYKVKHSSTVSQIILPIRADVDVSSELQMF